MEAKRPLITSLLMGFLMVAILGCGVPPKDPDPAGNEINSTHPPRSFGPGMQDSIPVAGEGMGTHCRYIPESAERPGILFLFDSHARGRLVVDTYKALADTFGLILVASNQSRNGISWGENREHIRAFISDAIALYEPDPARVWAMGFSGGARVAVQSAIEFRDIKGVLGCGAGFPSPMPQIKDPGFVFAGISGKRDFNFPEFLFLQPQLDQFGIRHSLIRFDGIHEWPPAPIVAQGLRWLSLCDMQSGKIFADKELVSSWLYTDAKALDEINPDHLYEKYIMLRFLTDAYQGISDVSAWQSESSALTASKAFQDEMGRLDAIIKAEGDLKNQFTADFRDQKAEWWGPALDRLDNQIDREKDYLKKESLQRIKGFLSLMAYLYSDSALKQGNLVAAGSYLDIYKRVDPENPEHAFLRAVLHLRGGDLPAALNSLQEAAALGFSDLNRLQQDPDLAILHKETGWREILAQIEKNAETALR